ncbi:MAG: HDOD domain-containing protein [Pseudomonadota bacterium]|nr:HDOD domain-containing protein [Pseudomonadota bacterium]
MVKWIRDAGLRRQLQELWRDGALVASIAYVLARETHAANPDEALVTGLMHNIAQLSRWPRRSRRQRCGMVRGST